MAHEIVMPKLGNTVESVIIVEWRKAVGDTVAVGEALCEVETDKATVDVEAEVAGVLLARLYEANDDVPVLVPFAVIGEAGEDVSGLAGRGAAKRESPDNTADNAPSRAAAGDEAAAVKAVSGTGGTPQGISPRARNLAASSGLAVPPSGSGPGRRVIERDIRAVLDGRAPLTPAARALGGAPPVSGSGIGGRVLASDMAAASSGPPAPAAAAAPAGTGAPAPAGLPGAAPDFPGPLETVALKGVRQVIARRMRASLQETAQLTLNSSAPAASLLAWRERFKAAPDDLGISGVSLNDLVMFVVSRLLPRHPELNAVFTGTEIRRFAHVHLGFAVDTPKGLMVPVIRFADRLSLYRLSAEARRLAAACREGRANPDDLSGGTFTITNLGAFGIESFTPVLNAPEVAILGVCSIVNRPVETPDGIGLEKRMGLSLTIDHQAVDGAPGARFLKDLAGYLANPEWVLAL
jgi:pyruvate dehydrogenase E2 component (dihydrolipoamide acetyltransferase)